MVVPYWEHFMFHMNGPIIVKYKHYIRKAMKWHRIRLRKLNAMKDFLMRFLFINRFTFTIIGSYEKKL